MDTTKDLCEVIYKTIEDQTFDDLDLYFSTTSHASEAFNDITLGTFLKILKDKGKHEDRTIHVCCVLSCLQHFVDLDIDSQKWAQMAEKISRLCELVFVISSTYIGEEMLVQKNIHTFTAIIDHSKGLVDGMLRYLLESLLKAASTYPCSNSTKLLLLGFIGSLLQKSTREMRAEVLPSVIVYLEKLSNYLLICGDYEAQVCVVEVLARCWLFIKESEHEPVLFSDSPKIFQMFKNFKFLNFDPDCRLFLNEVNQGLGEKQLVFSIPCMVVCSDNIRLKKPTDDSYKKFWIDFNLGSRSISFYYMLSDGDGWEVMNIEENNVLYATARNSFCKSSRGENIAAVKIEITLKHDSLKPELPKLLKIYTYKTREVEKVEKLVINKIYGNKYKSEVTYTDVLLSSKCPQDESMSLAPHDLKLNETMFEATSFIEQNTILPPQLADKREPDNSDFVRSSQDSSISEKSMEEQTVRTDQFVNERSPRELEENSRDSDSFSQFIRKRKEKEDKNNFMEDTDFCNESFTVEKKEISVGGELKKENEVEVKILEEVNTNSIVSMSRNDLLKATIKNCSKSDLLSSFKGNNVLPSGSVISDKQSVLQIKLTKSTSDTDTHKIEQNNNSLNVHNISSTSKKRRLYSCENDNIKDIFLSSQDHFSIDIPTYAIEKQQPSTVTKQNMRRKQEKNTLIHNATLFTDMNEIEQRLLDFEKATVASKDNNAQSVKSQAISFKYFANNERKLKALNKTPETKETCNLFPRTTVYSDFSSSERATHFKRTYTRPKQKKGAKKARVMKIISSDSDSDYIPSTDVLSKDLLLDHKDKKKLRNTTETFASRLACNVIRNDPIRDIVSANEMELEAVNIEEPKEPLREIAVDLPIEVAVKVPLKGSRTIKNSGTVDTKNNAPIKGTKKGRKARPVQSRKPRAPKGQEVVEKICEEVATETPVVMDIVHYDPETDDVMENHDLALEILSQISQDKDMVQTSFQISDMITFGKCCLTQINNRISQVQSLSKKEREMNLSAFDFKAQSCSTAVYSHCQDLQHVSNNLLKVKSLLDTTFNLQKDVATKLQMESAQLEEAKQELMKNITKVQNSESSQIATIFKGCGRFIQNLVFSFIQKSTTQKALPR